MPLSFLRLCMACYFSLEQTLSLSLGTLKFCNNVPWHGFIQSSCYAYSESTKPGNKPISSEKFLKWFLWKFLHAFFSFWNSYHLVFGSSDCSFTFSPCSPIFHFFVILLYFLEDFFNSRFLASVEFFFLCSPSERFYSFFLFSIDCFIFMIPCFIEANFTDKETWSSGRLCCQSLHSLLTEQRMEPRKNNLKVKLLSSYSYPLLKTKLCESKITNKTNKPILAKYNFANARSWWSLFQFFRSIL